MLVVAENKIGNEGMQAIAAALKHNTSVTKIDFRSELWQNAKELNDWLLQVTTLEMKARKHWQRR